MSVPDEVTVYEVGPRDGLQNEDALVPTEVKVRLVEELSDAGLPMVEVTSFVSPRAVPQLADAEDVMRGGRHRRLHRRVGCVHRGQHQHVDRGKPGRHRAGARAG